MKIILKIKEGGQFLPVNKSQIKKDSFASTKVGAILYLQLGQGDSDGRGKQTASPMLTVIMSGGVGISG